MSKEKEKVSVSEVERLNARIRNLEDQNNLLQAFLDKTKAEDKQLRSFLKDVLLLLRQGL